MGKFNSVNFSGEVQNKLGKLASQRALYVDGDIGDDKNDGTTELTPLKTIYAATSKINGKTLNYHLLYIRPGVYNEALALYDLTGILYVAPTPGSSGNIVINGISNTNKILDIYSPILLANNSSLISLTNIEIRSDGMSENDKSKLVALVHVVTSTQVIMTNCTVDGIGIENNSNVSHPVGLYARGNANVQTYNCTFGNLGIPVYANYGSDIKLGVSKFTNIYDGYAVMHGGIINGISGMYVDTVTGVELKRANNSMGLSIDHIERGAVVESGSNANGTYYKYGNGLLVCISDELSLGKANKPIGSLFKTEKFSWTYPAPFINRPHVNISSIFGSGQSWGALDDVSITSSVASPVIFSVVDVNMDNLARVEAVGRWK